MALSKKFKAVLNKVKIAVHPVILHKTKKLCKEASDSELLLIKDCIKREINKRGIE